MTAKAQGLNRTEITLLERVAKSPVSFTHAPTVRGTHTKLVRSSVSPSQQAPLRGLAVRGYLSMATTGSAPHFPLETTITYTLTSMGRDALGIHSERQPLVNRTIIPTEDQMAKEGCK